MRLRPAALLLVAGIVMALAACETRTSNTDQSSDQRRATTGGYSGGGMGGGMSGGGGMGGRGY